MELVCTLLTGFFFWLMVFHCYRKSIARTDRMAGRLLARAGVRRMGRLRRSAFFWLTVVLAFNVVVIAYGPRVSDRVYFGLGQQLQLGSLLVIVLSLGIPARRKATFEVRESGVLCMKWNNRVAVGKLFFVPWNLVAYCQWVPRSFDVDSQYDDILGFLTIAQDAFLPSQLRTITVAVGRFAPVYDHDGTVLAEPDRRRSEGQRISYRDLDRPPLQFDLQTMLLAMVLVASFAGLLKLHYGSEEYRATMRIESFRPLIEYWGDDRVRGLNFSMCAKKPTDRDLADLKPLAELRTLDLSGAPISDGGLQHLQGLKNLRYINLTNTRVTGDGVRELQRALPKVCIHFNSWTPSTTAPLAPSRVKKGK